jgi:hypothetical protein
MNTSDSVGGGVGVRAGDVARGEGRSAPSALVRSGVAVADLVALPLLALAFLVVLGAALGSIGIAAGGLDFILGLHYLDFFPIFPPLGRLLSGLSMLAFSALMVATALLLWRLFRHGWRRFWSWHGSAWAGTFERSIASRDPGPAAGNRNRLTAVKLSGLVFLCLFAVSFVLMMLMAGGPFWHAWRWFV